MQSIPAILALDDGSYYLGTSFGAQGEVSGEVCFNTSMTGYQEILTDPSYRGQIVTMTYPQIGNYGTNPEDVESRGIFLSGFVCREICDHPSSYRSNKSLNDYLKEHGVIGIEGIDTRSLVRRLRIHGVMTGVISTTDLDPDSVINKAKSSPELVGRDLVKEVLNPQADTWETPLHEISKDYLILSNEDAPKPLPSTKKHVVALDYGMKHNIARHLVECGCKVTVLPGTSSAEEILKHNPDGVFLSNGPGDPRPLTYAIETIKKLLGKKPIFGICLGQQLLGLAMGAEIFKLKFGHRGANQPVKNCKTGQVEITAQNHGFALNPDTLPDDVEITHTHLNDNTISGIKHKTYPAYGVQYHPESSSGPHDSRYLFKQFISMMEEETTVNS